MGAHNSCGTFLTPACQQDNGMEEWEHTSTWPRFKGHEVDYLFIWLGFFLLMYILRQCFRKMFGTTRVTFAMHYRTNDGEEIRVVGNQWKLGQWDPNRAAPMTLMNKHTNDPVWVGYVDLDFPLRQPLEYKYVLLNSATGSHGTRFKEWEPCANRILRDKSPEHSTVILHQYWGGHDAHKVPHGDLVGCNPLMQPLIGG